MRFMTGNDILDNARRRLDAAAKQAGANTPAAAASAGSAIPKLEKSVQTLQIVADTENAIKSTIGKPGSSADTVYSIISAAVLDGLPDNEAERMRDQYVEKPMEDYADRLKKENPQFVNPAVSVKPEKSASPSSFTPTGTDNLLYDKTEQQIKDIFGGQIPSKEAVYSVISAAVLDGLSEEDAESLRTKYAADFDNQYRLAVAERKRSAEQKRRDDEKRKTDYYADPARYNALYGGKEQYFSGEGQRAREAVIQRLLTVEKNGTSTGIDFSNIDSYSLSKLRSAADAAESEYRAGVEDELQAAEDRRNENGFLEVPGVTTFGGGILPVQSGEKITEQLRTDFSDDREIESAKKVLEYYDKKYEDDFGGQYKANRTMGRLSQDQSLAWSNYLDNPTEGNKRYAEALGTAIEFMQANNAETLDEVNAKAPWITKELANYMPQFWDQIKQKLLYGVPAAAVGTLVGAAVDGFPGALAGAKKGYELGNIAGSGAYSYNTMRGAAYINLINAGVDPETARRAANDEAVISSAIEMGDTALDLLLLGGDKVLSKILRTNGSALSAAERAILGDSKVLNFLAQLGKFGINVLGEGLEEETQESVSIANERRAKEGKTGIGGLATDAADLWLGTVTGNTDAADAERIRQAGRGGRIIALLTGAPQAIVNNAISAVASSAGTESRTRALENLGFEVREYAGSDAADSLAKLAEEFEISGEAERLAERVRNGQRLTDAELGVLFSQVKEKIEDERRKNNGSISSKASIGSDNTDTEGENGSVEGIGSRADTDGGRTEIGGQAGEVDDGRKVSAKTVGVPDGTDRRNNTVVTDAEKTPEQRRTDDRAEALVGVRPVAVTGEIEVRAENGERISARAVATDNAIIAQVDSDEDYRALVEHEVFHKIIDREPIVLYMTREAIRRKYDREQYQKTAERYVKLYRGIYGAGDNATESEIRAAALAIDEEICADAYSGINEDFIGMNTRFAEWAARQGAQEIGDEARNGARYSIKNNGDATQTPEQVPGRTEAENPYATRRDFKTWAYAGDIEQANEQERTGSTRDGSGAAQYRSAGATEDGSGFVGSVPYEEDPRDNEMMQSISPEEMKYLEEVVEEPKMTPEEAEKEALKSSSSTLPKVSEKESLGDFFGFVWRKFGNSGSEVRKIAKKTDPKLYSYFNMARSSSDAALYMIRGEQRDANMKVVGPSLMDIFEPIMEDKDVYQYFQAYLFLMRHADGMRLHDEEAAGRISEQIQQLRRDNPEMSQYSDDQLEDMYWNGVPDFWFETERLMELKKEFSKANRENKPIFGMGLSAEDAEAAAKNILDKYPDFKIAADKVYAYCNNLLDYRVQTGLISQRTADALKESYPHYVPAWGIHSANIPNTQMENVAEIGKAIKKAIGKTTETQVPIHLALAKQTMSVLRNAHKNVFGSELLKDRNMRAAKALGDIFGVEEHISPEGYEMIELLEREGIEEESAKRNNVFTVIEDGKKWDIIVSPALYDAVKSLDKSSDDKDSPLRLMRAITNGFKKLCTSAKITFPIRNALRDLQDASLYSVDLRSFVKNYPRAIREITKGGEYWKLYQALGGVNSYIFDFDTGKIDIGKDGLLKKAVERYEGIDMAIEQFPRLSEFMTVIDKAGGLDKAGRDDFANAIYAAADVTVNFKENGEWGKVINTYFVPFFNPALQGAAKAGRTVKEAFANGDAKKALSLIAKAAVFGIAPAAIGEAVYGDDEEWQIIDDRTKADNYIFKIGDQWFKLPKGRMLSVIGAAAAMANRAAIEETKDGKKANFREFLEFASDQISPANPFTENFLSPMFDAELLNADNPGRTWYDTDIEPKRLQSYSPGLRYDASTDKLSKLVGGWLNISPKKINYLLKQYSGGVGDIVLPLLTHGRIENVFGKAFTLDPVKQNNLQNRFYDELDAAERAKNEPGASSGDAMRHKYLTRQNAVVSTINKEIRRIETELMKEEDRDDLLKIQYGLRNTAITEALDSVDDVEKAAARWYDDAGDMGYDEDERKEYAYIMAQKEIFGTRSALAEIGESTIKKADEAQEKFGIDNDLYFLFYWATKGKKKREENLEAIDEIDVSDGVKDDLYRLKGYSEKTINDAPWNRNWNDPADEKSVGVKIPKIKTPKLKIEIPKLKTQK